jgi:uncharacterized protein with gpF-like domain
MCSSRVSAYTSSSYCSAVDKAIEEGDTLKTFSMELLPLLDKAGWTGFKDQVDPLTGETKRVELGTPRRLKIIYDTNMRVSRAAGQWQRIERTAELRPFLLYQLGPSERHRPQHAAWNGTLLPVDDPFWDVAFPPNGWGCKCHVIQLSDVQATRFGGVKTPPPFELHNVINLRTGEEFTQPKGIDPGWAYNPGKQAA